MPDVSFRCPPHLYGHIPAPAPARSQIPAWYRDLPTDVHYAPLGIDIPTAKRCPPFLDVLLSGFYLPLSTDIIYDGENFQWRPLPTTGTEPYPTAPISFHPQVQAAGTPLGAEEREIVKFINFWTIDLTPGWSILVTHPAHQIDLPFQTISAVIDVDRYTETFIQIPTLWLSRGEPCIVRRGTPIAHCFPIPREQGFGGARAMDAAENAALEASIRKVIDTPGIYKKSFRDTRKSGPADEA
jgi:hypothetical protein